MKKIVLIAAVLAVVCGMTSCKKDPLGCTVNVKVTNMLGMERPDVTVYMYRETEPTSATLPSDAKKQSVTNSNGIAEFQLNFTELNIIESQTSLYFVVFYTIDGTSYNVGSSGVTVTRNSTYDITVTIPI